MFKNFSKLGMALILLLAFSVPASAEVPEPVGTIGGPINIQYGCYVCEAEWGFDLNGNAIIWGRCHSASYEGYDECADGVGGCWMSWNDCYVVTA